MPKVSVLMPAYNNAGFLEEAVESIRGQSLPDWELVVVDDGSTDGSWDLLQDQAAREPRIRLFKNDRNRGIVYSLNRGLRACRGGYVARMDSDDISMPRRLERQVEVMDTDPGIVVLGGALSYIDGEGRELGLVRHCRVKGSLLDQNPLLHPTVLIRRHVLERHGLGYEERFRYAEDYYLWLQMSRLGRLAAIDDVILKYRLTPEATRMRHLRGMLLATLKVKTAGMFRLGIPPRFADLGRFLAEAMLLLVPASLVRRLYLRWVLGAMGGTAI